MEFNLYNCKISYYNSLLFLILAVSGCSTDGSSNSDAWITGPPKIDANSMDIGIKANPEPMPNPSQELPDYINDHGELVKTIREKLEKKEITRFDLTPLFSEPGKDLLIRKFERDKIVLTCSDFPYKTYVKGKIYKTDCAGIEHLSDGNESVVYIDDDNHYFNRTNLLYFSRAAYYLGQDVVEKKIWDKINTYYHFMPKFNYDHSIIEKVQDKVAVITYEDWGNYPYSIINEIDHQNPLSKKYGENRLYSPHEGVIVHETVLDIPWGKYPYMKSIVKYQNVPRKYYGFVISINNRISLSGHTFMEYTAYEPEKNNFDFTDYEAKVLFYKNYIKSLDFKELYDHSKSNW